MQIAKTYKLIQNAIQMRSLIIATTTTTTL
jgi:hypothetical protein